MSRSEEKYGLHGKMEAQEGKGDQLADILLQAASMMASAPGCDLYMVSQDPNDADVIWVTEVWHNKEDHDQSLKIDGVGELISQALPLFASPPQGGMALQVLGGHGI
jgi:quinol monooxygenase YgiN